MAAQSQARCMAPGTLNLRCLAINPGHLAGGKETCEVAGQRTILRLDQAGRLRLLPSWRGASPVVPSHSEKPPYFAFGDVSFSMR